MTSVNENAQSDQYPPKYAGPKHVNARAVYLFAALLALLLVLIQPLMGGLLRIYRGARPVEHLTALTVDPGSARHWSDARADLAATRAREERNIGRYAWIDREKGVVQIPVERAMELTAQRGGAQR